MASLGQQQKEKQQAQLDEAARATRMLYDAYVKAGFSPKMAFELVKIAIATSLQGTKK